jgi:hypothetical protein
MRALEHIRLCAQLRFDCSLRQIFHQRGHLQDSPGQALNDGLRQMGLFVEQLEYRLPVGAPDCGGFRS